ncbi:thiol-disulfide oxidoreductase [Limnochorda pilosa]|uniref:Thiol-disulfide oxidoreductase n=3 Tax=Limnochorda pilosa TaxID=1555112 RepID=A0A0K2SGR1_LIMPI|nr:hypothetical protein [Limnochorda pilosa]BAS26212.1 thiol-disulfide oxidoreductase [Limnochorda pilosa]
MAFVMVPHPVGMITEDEVVEKADAAFPEILKTATCWRPSRTEIPDLGKPPYPADVFEFRGTYAQVNELFLNQGWSLGLPIVPPTVDRVQEMLTGTSHAASEVVWDGVPPRMGTLTVELVAALGVMAGCTPEHMPLLLAVVEALASPEYNWRAQTTTTHPVAPLVLVNGPIRHEVGVASGAGAAGGGHLTNVCVGYFINLLGDVVGGSKAPDPDKTDQGWAGNIVATVVGENEEANPWQPYHVEMGFMAADSVVTVAGGSPPGNNSDHSSTHARDLVENLAVTVAGQRAGLGCLRDVDGFLLLTPEHAATIAHDGWGKDDIRRGLWEYARYPYRLYPGKPGGKSAPPFTCDPPQEWGAVSDETPVPPMDAPESIHIAVVGGPGKHSQYWDGQFAPPVSVLVDKWR